MSNDGLMHDLESAFAFLRSYGLQLDETLSSHDPLIGTIISQRWTGLRAPDVVVRAAPARGARPPVVSVLVSNSEGKSFTLTDWIHAQEPPPSTPLLHSTAQTLDQAIRWNVDTLRSMALEDMGEVLRGSVWYDVPTYRGVND